MKFPRTKVSEYFPNPLRNFGGNVNVKADLSNYATKTDIKNISHIDTLIHKFSQSKNWIRWIRHWQNSTSSCWFE